MSQNETQSTARAAQLARAYSAEWYGAHGALTAIYELLAADFPPPGGATEPTRYQVDALRALKSELSALVEGYERVG